jgi:hypothetical protein
MTAPTAAKRVLLILGDDGLDGGQLEHLMTMRLGVSTVKEPGTFIALLRDTGNDLVDLLRRHQHALVSLVPWLSTWLASRRRLLRSGFRTGTIAGGRLRRVPRRLRERLFQRGQLSPQLRNDHIPFRKLPSQLGDQFVAGIGHSSTRSCGDQSCRGRSHMITYVHAWHPVNG